MAQPLTKTKDGTLYTRFPEIEAAVDAALGHDLDRLTSRAIIRDRKSPEYLPSECLVHLIRDAHRRGDEGRRDRLLVALLERCHAILNKKVDGDIPNAIVLRKQILNDFAALFAIDGSADDKLALDYFEVRFNHAFQRLRISCLRPVLALLEKETEIPEAAGDTVEGELDNEVLARLATLKGSAANPEERVFRNQVVRAINALPPDERKALVLVHYFGFKIEAQDPTKTTAATLCGVRGRTIQNRLNRAKAKLSKLKEVS
jgi:DNA-directed RNA polymerase specialized sigma24 family protein